MNCDKKRALLCALSYFILKRNRQRRRSKWIKTWLSKKQTLSHLPLLQELRQQDPDDLKNYLRMDETSFNHLLDLVKIKLTKQNTQMRECIPPYERLVATLRYLATGRTYEDLKFSTGISAQSLGHIIPETCQVLYEELKHEFMKFPQNQSEWIKVASGFNDRFQFVNCGGALDGKHIRIRPPSNSGAKYYNYKGFHSIILMALVDSNYEFIYVDVGKQGRMSDAGALEWTKFYQLLKSGNLHFPAKDENIANLNFVIIADEGFALHRHILRPYNRREINYEKRIYNYRLSRARNVVEDAFGMLAARFRIFQTTINITKPDSMKYIILACCVLHNYLRRRSKNINLKSYNISQDNNNQEVLCTLTPLQANNTRNTTEEAKLNRHKYCEYFNGLGRVSWQDEMLRYGRA